jgi:hypothetical protein
LLGVLGSLLGVVGGGLRLLCRLLVVRCASNRNENERDCDYQDG